MQRGLGMDASICVTCGTQYPPSSTPPKECPICLDERQFVPVTGQAWTTLPRLARTHWNTFRYEQELLGIGTSPAFAIGQRALLVRGEHGNVLWDCISLIDRAAIDLIRGLGGLAAIAISHPHYYTTMLEWSRAFGGAPIYLHAADRAWIMREGPEIVLWEDDRREIAPGLTLIRGGGHYEGGTILHWAEGAEGRGALLSGDILQVTANKHVAFMRSYPNYLPLGAAAVRGIAARLADVRFETIYGAFWDRVIAADGRAVLDRSVARHIEWVEHQEG